MKMTNKKQYCSEMQMCVWRLGSKSFKLDFITYCFITNKHVINNHTQPHCVCLTDNNTSFTMVSDGWVAHTVWHSSFVKTFNGDSRKIKSYTYIPSTRIPTPIWNAVLFIYFFYKKTNKNNTNCIIVSLSINTS